MKNKITFLVKFLILTSILFIIWIPLGKIYLLLLAWVSNYVLWFMGFNAELVTNGTPYFLYRGINVGMENAHLSNYNIIPLLALIFATSGVVSERRIKVAVIGICILFCMHVIDFVSHFPMYFHGSEIAGVLVIFMSVGKLAVPLVLWFVLVHKEILESMQ